MDEYLPLTAGEENKLTGPLGLTQDIMYGTILPENGFEGQLFFLEDESSGEYLPSGGTTGQALIKNSNAEGDASWQDIVALPKGGDIGQALIKVSSTDGDAEWKEIVALPKGGTQGQILTKSSSTDGDAAWQNFPELNYLPLSGGSLSGSLNFANNTLNNIGDDCAIGDQNIAGCIVLQGLNGATGINFIPYSGTTSQMLSIDGSGLMTVTGNLKATQVYVAVWNDYAEYRAQKEKIEPGYCVASADNGQIYKTTEKFQACDGIVSDTFGFAIGETDECKTPLAVAGRVLAYCEGDKYDYHSGDTVCAGPDGKVCKMTREEVREWPDRIIGIVSEIPEYKVWGTGNINVNGRIWIKVK